MAADGNREVNLEMESHPNGGDDVQGVGTREMGHLERVIYLQVELYADEENDSTEIKRKKRMARAALTMWKESSETTYQRILQNRSEIRSSWNEVYQLVGLYSVCEGVVWTAVTTSSRLECQHLWSPVGLALFAYSVLVVVAFTKFREIRGLLFARANEKLIFREIETWVHKLRKRGYVDFDFERDCKVRWHRRLKVRFWRAALVFIVSLTIFTAGLVFSLVHILCWS